MESESEQQAPAIRKTSRFLAFVASLLCPGLGQLYNGQPKKAATLCFLVMIAIPGLLFFTGSWWLAWGLSGTYFALCLKYLVWILVIADSVRFAGETKPAEAYNRWWIYTLIILSSHVVGGGLRMVTDHLPLTVRSYYIASGSMIPTLTPGDYVFADMSAFAERGPNRFEIAVLRSPANPSLTIVKRIVGLPGETLELSGGEVLIDGEPLKGPWGPPSRSFGPEEIPEGHYFVLGDNIDESRDSRFIGAVPYQNLEGRIRVRIWPPTRAHEFP